MNLYKESQKLKEFIKKYELIENSKIDYDASSKFFSKEEVQFNVLASSMSYFVQKELNAGDKLAKIKQMFSDIYEIPIKKQ